MANHEPIRWGILSTANIARGAFLPGLRAAGGVAYAVGGRDPERTRRYAADNGIEHAFDSYRSVVECDEVDAVYIPLPNSLHAEWTIAALQAEKAVLCEKPLCLNTEQTEQVLEVAHARAGLLWEAFVFPWREQTRRLCEMIDAGEIGEVREIHSSFHFPLRNRANIRLDPALGGGSLLDVGCYCVRLARLVFAADAAGALAVARWSPEGVDEDLAGVLAFSGDRRLLLSCGMDRPTDTFSRILGTESEITLSNPFHPKAGDTMILRRPDGSEEDRSTPNNEPSFTPCIQHIHRVLWGEESPQNLAEDDAIGNAVALDLVRRGAESGKVESATQSQSG